MSMYISISVEREREELSIMYLVHLWLGWGDVCLGDGGRGLREVFFVVFLGGVRDLRFSRFFVGMIIGGSGAEKKCSRPLLFPHLSLDVSRSACTYDCK